MKRSLDSSDSLGALMSICPPTTDDPSQGNSVYGGEFQSMLEGLDEEEGGAGGGHVAEKKRRLSVEQDGSSDSDSSVILNEETSSYHSSEAFLISHEPFPDCFKFPEHFKPETPVLADAAVAYPPLQFVKIEEQFSGEESCSTLFSDEQPPTLHWYCPESWNNWKEDEQ
nr:homeobox-leucine zipper protein ATHB-6-like [Ipomoea batatas]